jgi:arginine exporter protein ArgO
VVTYFLIGALLGAITGIPIGPVNVAVIDASYRHSLRRAVGVALGGAVGDTIFAYLGMVWFGPFINARPLVPPILYILSGIALLVYGFVTVRSQEIETGSGKPENSDPGKFLGGFILGFILIVLNPAALITWVVIVGTYFAEITAGEGTSCAIGVGVGSLMWFNLVAYLSNKGKNVLGHKMLWVTRGVGILLIGYGLYSVGKGAWMLFKLL